MTDRIEAGDSAVPDKARDLDPTGRPVSKYVDTTEPKILRARASSSVKGNVAGENMDPLFGRQRLTSQGEFSAKTCVLLRNLTRLGSHI